MLPVPDSFFYPVHEEAANVSCCPDEHDAPAGSRGRQECAANGQVQRCTMNTRLLFMKPLLQSATVQKSHIDILIMLHCNCFLACNLEGAMYGDIK